MRFWHKILLLTLIVFIAAIDISIITIMRKSWKLNMSRDIERASSEQSLIANNIYENLNSIKTRGVVLDKQVYYDVTLSYADYYSKQGIHLQLWLKDEIIYPLVSYEPSIMPTTTVEQISVGEIHTIQISKNLPPPYNEIMLVYQREIESLYEMQKDIGRSFLFINVAVGLFLLIVLYFIVKGLTKPLTTLSDITKQIADGDYTKRIDLDNRNLKESRFFAKTNVSLVYFCKKLPTYLFPIDLKNKDEFGDLAYQFNKMTDAVEDHVTKLSILAETNQRMVDNMAHEIRTPLTSMQGFADFLLNAKYEEEERIIALEYIRSETKRLNKLVFKLLDISNLKHEYIHMGQVSVNDLFITVKQIEEKNLSKKNQQLLIKHSIRNVEGDFDLLVSFLTNCIDNAIHASIADSDISLSAYEQDSMGVIEICDNGLGMSNEQAEKAFEAFYKADKSRSKEYGGAGLGLTLCQQIAEMHNAEIKIESKIGLGTKVKIILQLYNNF